MTVNAFCNDADVDTIVGRIRNSMVQNVTSAVDSGWVVKIFPRYTDSESRLHDYKCPPLDTVLKQLSPDQLLTKEFSVTPINTH
jgi:hypothetical protein